VPPAVAPPVAPQQQQQQQPAPAAKQEEQSTAKKLGKAGAVGVVATVFITGIINAAEGNEIYDDMAVNAGMFLGYALVALAIWAAGKGIGKGAEMVDKTVFGNKQPAPGNP